QPLRAPLTTKSALIRKLVTRRRNIASPLCQFDLTPVPYSPKSVFPLPCATVNQAHRTPPFGGPFLFQELFPWQPTPKSKQIKTTRSSQRVLLQIRGKPNPRLTPSKPD